MASYTYKRLETLGDNEFYTGTYRNACVTFLKCSEGYYLNVTNILLIFNPNINAIRDHASPSDVDARRPKVVNHKEIIEKWKKSMNTQYNKEHICSRYKIHKYIFDYSDKPCYNGTYIHEKLASALIHTILLPLYSNVIDDMLAHLMGIKWDIGENGKNVDEIEISTMLLKIIDRNV